jgi:hypothetical protein
MIEFTWDSPPSPPVPGFDDHEEMGALRDKVGALVAVQDARRARVERQREKARALKQQLRVEEEAQRKERTNALVCAILQYMSASLRSNRNEYDVEVQFEFCLSSTDSSKVQLASGTPGLYLGRLWGVMQEALKADSFEMLIHMLREAGMTVEETWYETEYAGHDVALSLLCRLGV